MQIGVIFDWDGVIVDSSSAHERSWELLAEEESQELPEGHFKRGFGRRNETIIPEILQWTQDVAEVRRLADRKETLYRELIAAEGLKPLPGVRALLEELESAKIPRVVGSSTPRGNLDAGIAATGLGEFFGGYVSGDDVTNGKPDPEVFLKAAALLEIDPATCLVFEDATFGIEAARSAGMKAVGVATTNPAARLKEAGAHLVIQRMTEINVHFVRGLFLY